VPYAYIRGVHAGLDHYTQGLFEVADRLKLGKSFSPDLLVFPVTPFASKIAADCKPGDGDFSRWNTQGARRDGCPRPEGRLFSEDATADHEAVVGGPHVSRPSSHSSLDDPYGTAAEEYQSAFCALAHVAGVARLAEAAGVLPQPSQRDELDAEVAAASFRRALGQKGFHEEDLGARVAAALPAARRLALGLRRLLRELVLGERGAHVPPGPKRASDALRAHLGSHAGVLLSFVYKRQFGVGADGVERALAEAAPAFKEGLLAQREAARRGERPPDTPRCLEAAFLESAASTEFVRETRAWWRALDRPLCFVLDPLAKAQADAAPELDPAGAWLYGVQPILELLIALDGQHDVTVGARMAMRTALVDRLARGAMLVHAAVDLGGSTAAEAVLEERARAELRKSTLPGAPDFAQDAQLLRLRLPGPGHPLACCAGPHPNHVLREHMDPMVLVVPEGEEPRCCLIAGKVFALRYLINGLLGAHLGVPAQVSQLDGQLVWRISSDFNVRVWDGSAEGRRRSVKAYQVSGRTDSAYGDEKTFEESCRRQREVWDQNIWRHQSLMLELSLPLPREKLERGIIGDAAKRCARIMGDARNGHVRDEGPRKAMLEAGRDPAASLARRALNRMCAGASSTGESDV
jgi:hypothetical protein